MGQYYCAYVNDGGKETVYSLQSTKFRFTRNYEYYIGIKLMEHSYYGNSLTDYMAWMLYHHPVQLAWVGDCSAEGELWEKCWGENSLGEEDYDVVPRTFDYTGKWFVNHNKRCGLRLRWQPGELCIWPISILTAHNKGNTVGYIGVRDRWVGPWSLDTVSIEDELPDGYEVFEAYFSDTDEVSVRVEVSRRYPVGIENYCADDLEEAKKGVLPTIRAMHLEPGQYDVDVLYTGEDVYLDSDEGTLIVGADGTIEIEY